jgi:hypothetical protein
MSYEHVRLFRQRVKAAIVAGMGGKCRLCGYSRCNKALSAHHLDPKTKEYGLCGWASMNSEKILTEMKKCVLLCMNCHMEVHDGSASVGGLDVVFDEDAATQLLGCISRLRRLERTARGEKPRILKVSGHDWEKLLEMHGDKQKVSKATGVSYSTVRRIYDKMNIIHRRSG